MDFFCYPPMDSTWVCGFIADPDILFVSISALDTGGAAKDSLLTPRVPTCGVEFGKRWNWVVIFFASAFELLVLMLELATREPWLAVKIFFPTLLALEWVAVVYAACRTRFCFCWSWCAAYSHSQCLLADGASDLDDR
ncbi:hypothetical protein Nepgr_015866 [Nepenthes gracilis]|uniref:Uncharacterized protein n=1 Tax=Nepenthes gracilis TaxID=150966 RepID=A0AAD3XS07_NEPGR|nr:hypothetical protein Nepgr_015866 [Nepenthes gracilis]